MDIYLLISSLTLLMQIGVFLLVVEGFLLKKQRRFRAHGFSMLSGLLLHILAIGVIMVPSLVVGLVPFILEFPFNSISLLSCLHAGLGSVAAALGLWVVFSWRLRRSLQFCAPKRKVMRVTFWVWGFSLFSGFLLYLSLFWHNILG
jgi:uncharacterized membrane protein YozB (DUF420 family)